MRLYEIYGKRKKVPEFIRKGERLSDGRNILPEPSNGVKWVPQGKPRMYPLYDLDFNPDGLATAESSLNRPEEYEGDTSKPIAVTIVDNIPHVLNGYHRSVVASMNGEKEILVQFFK